MPDTPNKFTSMLKHHRIHMSKVWIDKAVQGIKTTWQGDAQALAALRDIIEPPAKPPVKLKAVGGKK
jgi:hypothetical protein